MQALRNYIDGSFREPSEGARLDNVDPAVGRHRLGDRVGPIDLTCDVQLHETGLTARRAEETSS